MNAFWNAVSVGLVSVSTTGIAMANAVSPGPVPAQDARLPRETASLSIDCAGSRDLALRNGKIVTMSVPPAVSEVVIRDGIVVHIGPGGRAYYTPCTKIIDLHGRTAIPGLIDAHMHFVTWGFRPGHDLRLDTDASIADVKNTLAAEVKEVGPAEWITAVGGWSRSQFAEGRLPTMSELDAVAPTNPVFMWERDGQPAVVNTPAARFLAANNVVVAADGLISAEGARSAIAYSIIAHAQTNAERGTKEALNHLASLGVTAVADMGVNAAPGGDRPPEKSWHSGHVDVYSAYDPLLALAGSGRLTTRVRIDFMDTPDAPSHDAQRLRYQFPSFGNDMLKTLCMGEFITPDPARYAEAALAVARRGGWCHEQHVMGLTEIRRFVAAWEAVDKQVPLAGRHWRLAHVFGIDDDALGRLRKLGAGVNIAAMLYATGNQLPGPSREIRYRSIVASGIPVAGVSDGPNYMPVDPWVHMSLMVRGTDSQGRRVVAADQTLSRTQALALYTSASAWFMADDRFGVIRPGGFGDIVVLDRDYLSAPAEQIRQIHAAMTIVDGKVVYHEPTPVAIAARTSP